VIKNSVRSSVHHLPAGPPLVARITGALARSIRVSGRALGHRSGRLALGTVLSTVVTALVLAVPVVAAPSPGTGAGSPVVMGQDGRPLSSEAFAGLTSAATFSSVTGKSSAAPSATRRWAERIPTTAPLATRSVPGSTAPSATRSVPSSTAPAAPKTAAPKTASPETAAAAPDRTSVPSPAPAPAATAAGSAATSEAPAATSKAPVSTPAPAPAPVAPAADSAEAQVLALVNDQRAAAGCGAVTADDKLAAVARAHSEDMRDRGFFSHVNPDGLDPFQRAERAGITARAENIARGQQDAAAVMDAWMNSAGHRANILNCDLTRLGVGIAEGSGGPWWTQLFA
jgi:uncharacterized protein YkwD